jgi:hypothetical protein
MVKINVYSMNSNEIQNDQLKSSLLTIETLQKEYEVTLQQYQEALQNYITSLEANNQTNITTNFVSLKGRTWWGAGGIKEGDATNEEECKNMCLSSSECTGATFNPSKHYCWTRTGNSSITTGQDDDYALIPKQIATLYVMTELNDKLLSLNDKIVSELGSIQPQVEEQNVEKNMKQQQLNETYKNMLEQKLEMEKQLKEYYSIEQDENNQYLYANQQNMSLKFWILIVCVVLIITIKKVFGLENNALSFVSWLAIIILFIFLSYSLRSPTGIFILFIFILFIMIFRRLLSLKYI